MFKYINYQFQSETLCMGERIKKGTFRPTVMTIPYSQITGALKAHFGGDEIHAVGHIIDYKMKDYFTYSPRERIIGTSKIPISIEFLVEIKGNIYVLKNKETSALPDRIEIKMGALRTKGFGVTLLKKNGTIEMDESKLKFGELNTRIPLNLTNNFMINRIIKPIYGFLLKPLSLSKAIYVKSLFEGSEVFAPEFLLKRGL